jgi:hypothetical protein
MTQKTILVLAVLALVFVANGCSLAQSPPPPPASASGSAVIAGPAHPCSPIQDGDNCFYLVRDGTAVPCDVSQDPLNYCTNTNSHFYEYNEADGQNYLCADSECDSSTGVPPPKIGKSCDLGKFVYNNLANNGTAWEVVNQQEDQNTTQQPITVEFTSTSATSVSTTASINVSVNVDALIEFIFASVRAQINASVVKTASTVVGNQVKVSVPPGTTANGIYGVQVQIASGQLYQDTTCGTKATTYGDVQAHVPLGSGWCVWLSGQTPCRVVSGN